MSHKTSLSDLMPNGALPLGLGCSRLGSVNGASGEEAKELLQVALDHGVRFFDTSNIYAQGDSERLLGEALNGRKDCVVCSKAGKYLTWKKRVLVPFKGVLRKLTRGSSHARQTVAAARAKPMPTRWDGSFLTASIDGSLRRLNRPQIEMFMLHSPSADIVSQGDAIDALAKAQGLGKIGIIGVSVDDVATAEAALEDSRVRALQIPLRPNETDFDAIAKLAAENGVAVIAREILGGAAAIAGAVDPAGFAKGRIVDLIRNPIVALPLVGTTRLTNLIASTDAAKTTLCK